MDYFTQLLESYSKLKKRKLKLLEQQDANSVAQSEVRNAQAIGPEPPTFQKPYIVPKEKTPGVDYGLAIFKTSQGIWKFAPLKADGLPNIAKPLSDPTFIGYFYQKAEGKEAGNLDNQAAGQQPALQQPQNPVDDGEIGLDNMWQEASVEIGDGKNIIDSIGKADWDVWFESGRGTGGRESFTSYLFGSARHSLQKLLNGVMRFKISDGGIATTAAGQISIGERQIVSSNLIKLMKLLNDPETDWKSTENKNFLYSTFQTLSNGTIVVRTGLGDLGVAFRDTNGSLNLMLNAALKQSEISLRTLHKEVDSTGAMNNIRGSIVENFPMLMDCLVALGKGKDDPILSTIKEQLLNELHGKMSLLAKAREQWTQLAENQALTEEELADLEALNILYENGEENMSNLVRSLGILHNRSRARGADVRIPYGLQTRNGERTDMFEGFKSREAAISALAKYGYSPEAADGLLSVKTVDQLVAEGGLKPEMAERIKAIYKVNGDEPLHMLSISMKAYMNVNKVKIGTMSTGSFSTFMGSDSAKNPFLQKAIKSVGQDKFSEAQAVHNDMEKIYNGVQTLDVKMKVRGKGKSMQQNVIADIAANVKELLKNDSDFEELYGSRKESNKIKKDLHNLASKILETNPEATEEELAIYFKKSLVSYLKDKKLHTMNRRAQKSGDSALASKVESYNIMRAWGTFGCAQETVAEPQELLTGESYRFSQNKILREISQGKWKQEISESGNVTFYRVGENGKIDKKTSITLDTSFVRRSGGGFGTTMSGHISKAAMIAMDPKNLHEARIDAGRLLQEFLDFQNKFMSRLLKLQ